MVHLQHACPLPRRQGPVRSGPRICLLKGCQRWFSPHHPRARYCGQACSAAARRWSRRRAARQYRATEQGKARRRQQARDYRERVRKRREEPLPPPACEGHQKADDSEKIPCSRPGCYELFPPECRSPLKKFCCVLCREALRRVRQREARWGWRSTDLSEEERWERFRGPPNRFR